MKIKTSTTILILIFAGTLTGPEIFAQSSKQRTSAAVVPSAQKAFRPTGTYSDMYYNAEGGDVLGDEIRIVYTRKGYQGVLQFAEGEPEELVIVSIEVSGRSISFTVPNSSPYAGHFNGTIENGTLKGEFQFKTGGVEKVELKKGKSYWD